MEKSLKEGLGFAEYLSSKERYYPYSLDISSVEEEFVISDDFDSQMAGVKELGFFIPDIKKDIKDYVGFLAFLNIIKTKNLLSHSNVYLEIEYVDKSQEDVLTRFYEKLNLWNVRLIIKPTKETNVEDYTKYVSAFITKVLNKETFVSMEPTETFIREKTAELYEKIQDRVPGDRPVKQIVKKLVASKLDYNELREDVLSSFREEQLREIELMINSVTKGVFDLAKTDPVLKHN